jgi:hypothetical protein
MWGFTLSKYFDFKVCGYFLYFTSHCVVEAMRVHASDMKLTESGSAKFFARGDGSTVVMNQGRLNARGIRIIRKFIQEHYEEMYIRWSQFSDEGHYEK